MEYAIIDAGGRQIWVEPGKYYDLNYIDSNPGDIVNFNRILFIRNHKNIKIGHPCINNIIIKAKVLKHLKGRKLIIFKMKPKKNFRIKQGHRQKMTRILIQDFGLNGIKNKEIIKDIKV